MNTVTSELHNQIQSMLAHHNNGITMAAAQHMNYTCKL